MSEGSVRSFVAVPLPDHVRAGLAAVSAERRGGVPEVAWVRAENLHVTVRFLGALEPAAVERAREAVRAAAAAVAPFTVTLRGLGGFPTGRAPRIIWASVGEGAEGLVGLHAALETALTVRGIPADERAFHPHVTLARIRAPRGAAGLANLLGAGPTFGEVRVGALHLMRSELHPRGARYTVLAEALLGQGMGPD